MACCCMTNLRWERGLNALQYLLCRGGRSESVLRGVGSAFSRFDGIVFKRTQAVGSALLKQPRACLAGRGDRAPITGLRLYLVAAAQQQIAMDSVQLGRRPHFTVLAQESKAGGNVRQGFANLAGAAADFSHEPVVERQTKLGSCDLQRIESAMESSLAV